MLFFNPVILSVGIGRDSCTTSEIPTEKGRIYKLQLIADLLNGKRGRFEEFFGLFYHPIADPLLNGFSRFLFDKTA